MAINFNSFTEGTTSTIQSNDYVVGFDTAVPGGERKYTVSTIANAVSGIMSTQLANVFVEESNFIGANRSLTTPNGFQKLPGGLIINWGGASIASQSNITLNYNQSFSTACLGAAVAAVCVANSDNWAVLGAVPHGTTNSLTQITLAREWSGAGNQETNWVYYIAIGY